MTIDDFDEFCEVVVGFAELKGKQLSPSALKLYFRAVQSWGMREFKIAAEHLLRTCEFMPTPKHFEDLRKAGRPDSAEAWEQAQCFANTLWHPLGYRNGSIGDRAIDLAVGTLGGYPAIAMCDTSKLQWLEKRFREAFDDASEKHSVREALPQIAAPANHTALRRPESLAALTARLESAIPGQRRAEAVSAPPALMPPPVPRKPTVTISARDKIAKLLPLPDMTDEVIAKITREPIELVCEVRTAMETTA